MVYDNVQERLKESVRPAQEIVVPFFGKAHKTKGIFFKLPICNDNYDGLSYIFP